MPLNGQEDLRDDRSFGTESDYYGDATIASSPRAASPASGLRSTRNSVQRRGPSNLRNARQPSPVVEDRDELAPPPPEPEPEPHVPNLNSGQPSNGEPELDDEFRKAAFGPDRNANTPAPKRLRLKEPPRRSGRGQSVSSAAERPGTLGGVTEVQTIESAKSVSSKLQASRGATRWPEPQKLSRLAPSSTGAALFGPSNHSEADEAMQKEIEASEGGGPESQSPWRDRWMRIKPFSPFQHSYRHRVDEKPTEPQEHIEESTLEDEDDELGNDNAIDWWSLFNPQTYLDVLLRLLGSFMVWTINLSRAIGGAFNLQRSFVFLGIIVLVGAIATAVSNPNYDMSFVDSLPPITISPWSGLKDFAGKIGDYAQSISFPFGGDSGLSGLWDLDEEDRHDLEGFLEKYDHDLKILKKAGKLHEASLEKLEKVVPKVVHMELKDGKPVVSQEFWHAMRDLLRADGGFLTVDKKGSDYIVSSDHHWRAIASKLVADSAFTSKLNLTMDGIEDRINSKMTSFWDGWIKDNDDKISTQLGSALDKLKSAASERELNHVVKKLVDEQLHDQKSQGIVVTRDEFLRHLKNEFAVHRSEIRAELNELQPQLEELIRESVELASDTKAPPPSGMTREDVTSLVNNLVRKALADANLEAMARGKIHAHWDIELKNQVNYFSVGAGALADPTRSAKTYDPYDQGVIDDKAYANGLRGAQPYPPRAALEPWHDEGDCWCAARQINHRGNPHGAALSVLLGHQIVPQHVVIEHILPGATIDPGARPRDIEVHARIEDPATRERVRDFSATHFPELDPSTEDWNAMPADLGDRFVKIGQFTYEGAELHDGVHVHRLSSELLAMRAETDQVVVRATSNYGAVNHTCFYRVRLYGHRLDVDTQ